MNRIAQIFQELSDADLVAMLAEMQELDSNGVLPDGKVRQLARRLESEAGACASDARHIVDSHIFRTAAYRWAAQFNLEAK